MGYMATVIIYMDALHEIENDPDFGKKVANAAKSVRTYDRTCRESFNSGFVAAVHHGDHEITIRVGHNTATVLKNEMK